MPAHPTLNASIALKSDIDIALWSCSDSRLFENGDILLSATESQFDNLVRCLVQKHVAKILAALDRMDHGCTVPGFRGFENGYGDGSAGDELQDAREELERLVGHVAAEEVTLPDVPFVETAMPRSL